MTRLLNLIDTFFKCQWCGLKMLTSEGCDAHETICRLNPANQK